MDVRIEYSDLAPELRQPWTAMGSRLAEVITSVRPAIAAVDRYLGPGLLPALTWTQRAHAARRSGGCGRRR